MNKYPKTYHFNFSPEIKNDDKVISFKDLGNFLNEDYIILEKMDGQNNCLKGLNTETGEYDGVFARSHQIQTKLPWDSLLIAKYHELKYSLKENHWYFLENMFAEHSIIYENLNNYFFLFNIYDVLNKEILSWDEIKEEASKMNFETPQELFRGRFRNISEIQKWMEEEVKKPSKYGSEREGFVMRPVNSFKIEDFNKKVGKYVRKGHVQTDEHWTKNWKQAKIISL